MGPLKGIRVVEMAGIGPGPFCGMLLGDLGADVVRIDRLGDADRGVDFPARFDLLNRNKRSIGIDLKAPAGKATALRLIGEADALIEGYRPGVMEQLGLGPDICLDRNPRLVFGRMTGWGQDGPLAQAAGHDLNYIALAGALGAIGRPGQPPTVPLNLIGDFGGGSLYLAMGILAAIIEARTSGHGQVVDAGIVDGTASLMTMLLAMKQMGAWRGGRGENLIDGGAPFYDVYETEDGGWVSIAPVERKFYAELLQRLGLSTDDLPKQNDPRGWATLRGRFADVFRSKTRDEWTALLEGTDACFSAVLSLDEAVAHPHNAARNVFVTVDGVVNPAPAPRFSRTPGSLDRTPSERGADTAVALADWGLSASEIAALKAEGAIA